MADHPPKHPSDAPLQDPSSQRYPDPEAPFPSGNQGTWEQRYQDFQLLGQGAMSDVFNVLDARLLRRTAMKVLDPQVAQMEHGIQRFLEEAQVTAQLEHPNIAPVFELGVDPDNRFYFTLQLVKGETLESLLQKEDYDPSSEVELSTFLQIFLKVCDALSFAHSRGVIHRDLKPANIMVGDHGQVYLMDWGLLRLTHSQTDSGDESIAIERGPHYVDIDEPGMIIGSPQYLSPEQAYGKADEIDARTDIFALGAMLYEILTKFPPYFAWTREELLALSRKCEIVPPQLRALGTHLPLGLCKIAMKALSKEPEKRYPSVLSLKKDLEFFLQGSGRFQRRQFSNGELIIREGESGDEAFLITRGMCEVFKEIDNKRITVRTMGPGELFGETAFFSSGVRTANVQALEDVTVKVIDQDALGREVGFDSWINQLVRDLAIRFRDVDESATKALKKAEREVFTRRLLAATIGLSRPLDEERVTVSFEALCRRMGCLDAQSIEHLREHCKDVDGIDCVGEELVLVPTKLM